MAAEVLLMADVKDLGVEGDVVTVADGYARNYLLPRNLAAPVTDVTRKRLEKIRREREEVRKAELEAARQIAEKLEQSSCTIPVKVGEEDKMFGSVTSADIAEVLAAKGVEIDKHKIALDEPIRELGVYDIRIKIHTDVDASVKIWIVEE